MSLEQAEEILKALRESTVGETPLTPGFLDRDITTQNPEVSQLGSTYDVVKRAQESTGRDFRGRGGEIGGKIYMDSSRRNFLPYRKDAIMGISDPSYLETFTQEAPYWATVGIGSLFTGGIAGEVGTAIGTMSKAAPLASQALHAGGFILGAQGGAYTTMAGADALGLTPDPYGQQINPGASTAAQTAAGLSTFVPSLPNVATLGQQARGAALFGGVVGGIDLAESGIASAMGKEQRDIGQIAADTALHSVEGAAFGLFMRPTKLGAAAIHGGAATANYKNALPSMVAESVFGGGLFKDGFVNTLTGNTTPSNLNVSAKNGPVVRNNAYGRGEVIMGPDGRPIAVEPYDPAAAQAGGAVAPAGNQSSQNSAKPSSTGRGDLTSFDPKTGSGVRVMVMPDGNTRYTLITNLGGEALKARGPYKDLPNVVEFNEYDMARMRFDEKWGAAAAEQAARAKAEQDLTVEVPGADGTYTQPIGPRRGRAPVSQESIPPVEVTPAEAVAGATKPTEAPKPEAPKPEVPKPEVPKPEEVTPAEAVAGAAEAAAAEKPKPVVVNPFQQAYEKAQEEERAAGEEQRLADAQEKAAEAAVSIDSNPVTQEALAAARKRSTEALIRLEKAQLGSESATLRRNGNKDSENVGPRPNYGEQGYYEWREAFGSTHDERTGKKFTPEQKVEKEKSDKFWEISRKFEEENKISALAEDYKDNELFAGQRRVIPRDDVPGELREKWDMLYASKYTNDGFARKYPAAPKPAVTLDDVAKPPVEAKPLVEVTEKPPVEAEQPAPVAEQTATRAPEAGETGKQDATREEILAGTRPIKETTRAIEDSLTPEERRTYIENRKKFLAEGGNKPPAAGETVVAASETQAAAVEAPAAAGKVDTPAKAADKVETEIERLIDLGDTKTAGDVHRKVIKTLQELAEHAKSVKPYVTKEQAMTTSRVARGKISVMLDGVEVATIEKSVTRKGGKIYLKPNETGRKKGLISLDWKSMNPSTDMDMKEETTVTEWVEGAVRAEEKRNNDPRRYVVRIPGDGTFSIKQDVKAVETLLQAVRSQGPAAWQGIVSKAPARKETPRFKKFDPTIPAQERKLLEEMLKEQEQLLTEDNEFLIRREISRGDLQESVASLKEALAKSGSEKKTFSPAIPDPQGRKNVFVQSAVVGERNKDTDRLQVVGVDAPAEIHKNGMRNPEPLELEAPGGPSSESWPAYQLAMEREGAKNVYIVRLPGTKEGGKSYNMAITGLVTIKFKKGQGGGVIPVLDSVGMDNINKSTKHWLNWKIVEFYPEAVDTRGQNWFLSDPRYSYNLAESGGKEFGEIQNTAEAKKEFVARLFATFEVLVPSDFKRDESTYGFDGKPTLYFNQSAMIEAERAQKAATEIPVPEEASPKEMTVADHWQVEKDREEAAKKVRNPVVTEAPETAKTKAQIQAESKAEGAKRYGASGVRFNIGGPKNPDSFGGEVRGEKGVVVASTAENWNEKDLKLIKDYLSPDAAILRNGGYPKFYFNTQNSGEDSNWVSAPVPAANGNFLVYEVNPAGSGAKGNSYNRTVRLFRRLVNSDGVQVGSMTEVFRGELVGMSTTSLAADGKPKFQVPAIFHAMMAAAQDSLASRQMTEGQVNYSGDVTNPNPLNKRIALSGTIHEDLKMFEENELSVPGLRDKMEVFNGMNGGESINAAIIGFMGDPNQSTSDMLSTQLQTNGLLAAQDARDFISQMAAQMGLEEGTYALVSEPHSDELYPVMKSRKIYPTEAQLMLKWIQAGYQRIIFEIGKHNEDTGEELPDKVPAMLNGKPRMLPNGKPMMVNNPAKWNAPVAQWMNAETFTVRDKDGNITFQPKPHQVVGPNAAMSRWFPAGVVSAPRPEGDQPRAILINDAPGTGKTLQMLMAAVLYRDQIRKLIKDPTSPWFGTKLQPVLIVTQNAQIIQNAFRGDANMAKINLNGKFTENGFEPDEYELLPDGGRLLTGESWIDIATYNSIKPTTQKSFKFEKDGKTPIMVDAFVRNEDGELIKNEKGDPIPKFDPVNVGPDGEPLRLKEHAFELIPIGPPKKGYGRWGAVMFDESHNMKNEMSGRADAGWEIMSQAQHVMLASGTPIDKPTQLGPLLGMLLDTSIDLIADELGMKITHEKRDEKAAKLMRAAGSEVVLERPVLKFAHVPWDNPEELDKYFNGLFLKLKMLRDRAGKGGAILRRSTKYFGIENIWMDPSDSMHENGRELLMKMHEWWYEEMSLAAEGGGTTGLNTRTLKGMMLFEMKRAAAQAKAGIPGTMWNPGSEPRGASKLLMDELAEGRKVILTMDTSNEYKLEDTDNIRRFRGLKDDNGNRLAYESEYVQWSRFLTERGIKFGIIKGGIDISAREAYIAEYQKNNPDLSVIIMTTQSGGTGLSIDDRHGVGGKTNPKKEYTPEEIARMKQVAAEEIDGEKVPSGSFPRTMIIVSSPWGGDVFIQAMGRTDRLLSTTPSRIIVLTTGLSEGDDKLISLVRLKTMAVEAMNNSVAKGDSMMGAIIMDAGLEADGEVLTEGGVKPITELGGVSATELTPEQKAAQTAFYNNKAKNIVRRNRALAESTAKVNEEKLANAKKNKSSNREIKRWTEAASLAREYMKYLDDIAAKFLSGGLSATSIIKSEKEHTFEEFKKRKKPSEDDNYTEEDEDGLVNDNNMTMSFPLGESIIPVGQGPRISISRLQAKGKKSKARQIIENIYGVHQTISGGKVTPETLAKMEKTVVDISEPYVKLNSEGKISDMELRALLRMAVDVSKLIYRYQFIIKTGDKRDVDYGGQMSFWGRAIMSNLTGYTTGPKIVNTAFHEISHALFEMMPEAEKEKVLAELEMARTQWQQSLEDTNPLKSVVFPKINWMQPEGEENYDWTPTQVKRPPVPYSTSKEFLQPRGKPRADAPFGPGVFFARELVGPQLAAKAFQIASEAAIKAGWTKSIPNIGAKRQFANIAVGGRGQFDIKPSGSTPAETSTRALVSLLQLASINPSKKTMEMIRMNYSEVTLKVLKTGQSFDKFKISLRNIIELADNGFGHFAVKPDGALVFSTKGTVGRTDDDVVYIRSLRPSLNSPELLSNNAFADTQILQMEIPGADVYKMFKEGFGRLDPSSRSVESVFRPPAFLDNTRLLSAASNSMNEFVTGSAANKLTHNTYKLANIDEWIAHNGAELFEDFYYASADNLSSLTSSITSSLYVHANANGMGSAVKGIIAALVSGDLEAQQVPDSELNMAGTDWHTKRAQDQMTQAQQSGSTSPPPIQTEAEGVTKTNSMTPSYGPARRKLEAASEGLEAITISMAQGVLDTLEIPSGSVFRKWLEDVRRRKMKTGEPNRITGTGPRYKFEHAYGTLIGQVEQIGQITKDPFVIDLASRLYPSGLNTGINARISLVEDMHAHTTFWNNRVNGILQRTLGQKIEAAKENKARTLAPNPQSIPGFRDDFVEYILKVHDPEYNRLERIKFEVDSYGANKSLNAEMKALGVTPSTIQKRMDELRRLATIDADSYGKPGSKYTNVTLGREADAFLGKYMPNTGVDKLFMDVGRCMAISKNSPEYATRHTRFDPEVIACADELSERWAGDYLSWAQTQGNALAEWGSSYVPRIVDANIVASYGSASGDDFVLTAAKAMLEDNKFQRVKLPSTLKALVEDFSVSKLIVHGQMQTHISRSDVYAEFDGADLEVPEWMIKRASELFKSKTMASSFMGYDVSCRDLVPGRTIEAEEPGEQEEPELTTIGAHISVNLNLYRRELERAARDHYGSLKNAMRLKQFRDEYNAVVRTVEDLAESHKRKVIAGPLSEKDAIKMAKKWRFRIDNRATGVQGGGEQGYEDLVSGQGSTIKRPDSAEQRTMDTEVADKILDRFYIRDPRVFIPSYNQSVTSNLMIKKHIPEGYFNALHKSVISNPESARFWPELTYLIAKIAGVSPTHDSSSTFRSVVTLASSAAFMPVTSMLQLTEGMPAGLHSPSSLGGGNMFQELLSLTKPGAFATADTLKIALLKSINAAVAAVTPLQTDAMLPHADKFMYRLAERSGVIMSTLMDDLPKSSADPRTKLQRFTDHMIQRYHQSGSALSTVTNMSRVAVLKANVLMLETTADDILLRELSQFRSSGAPNAEQFVRLLKPHELLMFRNLGIPDANLKQFLEHCLITRSVTQKDISKVPSYVLDKVLSDLVDSGYTEDNESSVLYANALNRLNMLTIQRSIPANMSRLRGLVDRHVGVFPGSVMFFLTNFNSAFGRNVVLPGARLGTGGFLNQNMVMKPGQQEPMYRRGVYATDIAYPISAGNTAFKMLPALAMMVAASSLVNYGTRQARMKLRADPASTYIDQKTIPEMVFAAVDQAGYTANFSLPINIVRALRYERETAQIAAGPFFGGLAGVVDWTRTYYGDKNSPNTPTAERAFAKHLYDMVLRPAAQVGIQAMSPNSELGDVFNFAMTQTMALPSTREAFMRWFAQDDGNQGQRVPTSKADLNKAFEKGLINRKQLLEGIKRRDLYDSQYKRDKAKRELDEAIQRRKESKRE